MQEKKLVNIENIQYKIYQIRGMQVMLDTDLAHLYTIKPIRLREQVKRNLQRFPSEFMFQLNNSEVEIMVSQNAIPSKQHLGGYLPYVFTEQGVAMLSGVLKSDIAITMSIQIIHAFVAMRKFISTNAQIFNRLESVEQKQLEYDNKLNKVFDAIESKDIIPKQGIFFDGQIFDAYVFVAKIIREAKQSIILIDNYVDETVLTLFSKSNVIITIYSSNISNQLLLDLQKYNSQYKPIAIKEFKSSHDRFLIIDSSTVYHFGASLKDLGKKWFGFSRFDIDAIEILNKLHTNKLEHLKNAKI